MGTFSQRLEEIVAVLRAGGVKAVPHGPGMAKTVQDLTLRVQALELEVEQRTEDLFEAVDVLEKLVYPKRESLKARRAARPQIPAPRAQLPQPPAAVGGPSVMPTAGALAQVHAAPMATQAPQMIGGATVAPNQTQPATPLSQALPTAGTRVPAPMGSPAPPPFIPVGSRTALPVATPAAPFVMSEVPPGVPPGVMRAATGFAQPAQAAEVLETTAEPSPETSPVETAEKPPEEGQVGT